MSLIERVRPDLAETEACRSLCRSLWKATFEDNLWHEICSEFDARRLADHLRALRLPLSEEFRRFEPMWLLDEDCHYLGFLRLYSLMYKVPPHDVALRAEGRPSSLSGMARFLTDEFHLCVLLAYDEAVTARAYARDFAIYDALGDRYLSAWIREVCRDESGHCRGAVEILKRRHAGRLAEVPRVLDELVRFGPGSDEYKGSFVLDHQHYPPGLIEHGRRAVLTLCNSLSARASLA